MTNELSPVAYSALLYLLENETDAEWNSNWKSVCEKAAEREGEEECDASLIAEELNLWAGNLY